MVAMAWRLAALPALVCADVYMQYPPGSNNRLAEGGGNRNNNNRLMDTQNNAKGGYGFGGTQNDPAPPVYYFTGSQVTMSWTSQHSCGSENAECQIVIQYMCNDKNGNQDGDSNLPEGIPTAQELGLQNGNTGDPVGAGPLRDGTNGASPDPNNPAQDRGLHEPTAYYQWCDARNRNKGLYVADQNLNNDDARRTRQNPNGARSGLECPEERDYYPYWHGTPWKDAAVLTNNLAQCDFYRSESQNVKPKGYCQGNAQANSVAECGQANWKDTPAFGIEAPLCLAHPITRDNHLGNGPNGREVMFNWTLPKKMGTAGAEQASSCAVRLRYNITTADTRVCEDPTITTRAECEAAGKIWSAFYLDSNYNDDDLNSNPPLPDTNPDVSLGGLLQDGGGEQQSNSLLELAINTNQYGRTFQDRSHRFSVKPRPAEVPLDRAIYNLNVKGKRGNIVQTYPATEYDYTPTELVVSSCDTVHFQWTGNGNTNNNGNNNGEGTNNEDKHNLVELDNRGYNVPAPIEQASMFDAAWEWNPEPSNSIFGGSREKRELARQFALVKQTGCAKDPDNDQANNNCQKLNKADFTIDLGLVTPRAGQYRYTSSRDNNFSNRAVKSSLTVTSGCGTPPLPPTGVVATPIESSDPAQAKVRVVWAPPNSDRTYTGTDGKEYVGVNDQGGLNKAYDYRVVASCDGGAAWSQVEGTCNSGGSSYECVATGLPAGTVCMFGVRAGGTGGWSDVSEPTPQSITQTKNSDYSKECNANLAQGKDGGSDDLSGGAIAAIVIGCVAGVVLIGIAIFMIKRREPPPPPPEFKSVPPS